MLDGFNHFDIINQSLRGVHFEEGKQIWRIK